MCPLHTWTLRERGKNTYKEHNTCCHILHLTHMHNTYNTEKNMELLLTCVCIWWVTAGGCSSNWLTSLSCFFSESVSSLGLYSQTCDMLRGWGKLLLWERGWPPLATDVMWVIVPTSASVSSVPCPKQSSFVTSTCSTDHKLPDNQQWNNRPNKSISKGSDITIHQ